MTITFYDPQAFQEGLDGGPCLYAPGSPAYVAYEAGERESTAEGDKASQWSECVMCGGPLALLGVLGQRTHYRCQMCGHDCSVS